MALPLSTIPRGRRIGARLSARANARLSDRTHPSVPVSVSPALPCLSPPCAKGSLRRLRLTPTPPPQNLSTPPHNHRQLNRNASPRSVRCRSLPRGRQDCALSDFPQLTACPLYSPAPVRLRPFEPSARADARPTDFERPPPNLTA